MATGRGDAVAPCARGAGDVENNFSLVRIAVGTDRLIRWAALATAFLALAGLAADVWKYYLGHSNLASLVRQFNLDEEANLPTLFSTLCLLACSALLFAIRAVKLAAKDPYTRHWTALGTIFLLMGIDETCEFHETAMHAMWKFVQPAGYFHFVWVVPGIVFVAAVGLSYWRFLFRLPRMTSYRFVLSGFIYVSGALGMEMISGKYMEGRSGPDFTYGMLATIEETLEMAGSVLFLRALAKYLAWLKFQASVTFEQDKA